MLDGDYDATFATALARLPCLCWAGTRDRPQMQPIGFRGVVAVELAAAVCLATFRPLYLAQSETKDDPLLLLLLLLLLPPVVSLSRHTTIVTCDFCHYTDAHMPSRYGPERRGTSEQRAKRGEAEPGSWWH